MFILCSCFRFNFIRPKFYLLYVPLTFCNIFIVFLTWIWTLVFSKRLFYIEIKQSQYFFFTYYSLSDVEFQTIWAIITISKFERLLDLTKKEIQFIHYVLSLWLFQFLDIYISILLVHIYFVIVVAWRKLEQNNFQWFFVNVGMPNSFSNRPSHLILFLIYFLSALHSYDKKIPSYPYDKNGFLIGWNNFCAKLVDANLPCLLCNCMYNLRYKTKTPDFHRHRSGLGV